MTKALLLIDIQNDFLPSGTLPVPDGDAVIAVANRLQDRHEIVIATQDFHPAEHLSFAANHEGREVGEVIDLDGIDQILWPVHCVQGTPGTEFPKGLETEGLKAVFQKGKNPRIDSYSGFFDNGGQHPTGLDGWLKERSITHLTMAGLATDYCVKFTALDAVKLGYEVTVVIDGCRGVGLNRGDIPRAIEEMRAADIKVLFSRELDG